MIKLIFFFLFNFLSFRLILNLAIAHFLFKLNFSLILFFFLSLSFIIKSCLFFLKFIIFLLLFFLSFFFSSFFLHLFIKLLFDFLFKLLFSHSFKLLLLFKKFSVKFNKSSPFIIIVSFNLVDRLRSH